MIQPITLMGAVLCLWVLYLRYRSQHKNGPRRSPKQKLSTAKILLAAALAWLGLFYTLQHMIVRLDGAAVPEPSLMERVVTFLSK